MLGTNSIFRVRFYQLVLVLACVLAFATLLSDKTEATIKGDVGGELNVCTGRASSLSWLYGDITSNRYDNIREKLGNSDNFGSNGTYSSNTFKFTSILPYGTTLTIDMLTDNDCHIWYSGYTNLGQGKGWTALSDFVSQGGFVIGGCEGQRYNTAVYNYADCAGVDPKYATAKADNKPAVLSSVANNFLNPIGCSLQPGIAISTSGGESGYFNDGVGIALARYNSPGDAAHDKALIVTDSLSNPSVILSGDSDLFTDANSEFTAGPDVTTNQDIMAMYIFKTAADKVTGLTSQNNGPSCTKLASNSSKASISLEKSATFNDTNSNGIAEVGETISYTFKVTNTGTVDLTDISITDPLVTVSGGPINLVAGASDASTFTATYTLTQADITAKKVVNQATATGEDPNGDDVEDTSDDPTNSSDQDPDNDGDPDDKTVTPLPPVEALSLEKSATFNDENGDGYAQVGETISYTFKVTNTGAVDLTDISISDPLVTVSGGPIDLVAGASDTSTFTATYTLTQADITAKKVVNQATATGENPSGNDVTDTSDDPSDSTNIDPDNDGDPDDKTSTKVTPFVENPRIHLTKKATFNDENSDGFAQAGETISYTFEVTNTGNLDLTGISITDPLVTVSGGPINLAVNGTDTTTFTATYTVTAADVAVGKVDNQATATGKDPSGKDVTETSDDPSDTTDIDPDNDGDPDDKTTTVLQKETPRITVEKIAEFMDDNGDGVAQPGEKIAMKYKVINTGNTTLTDILITDEKGDVIGGPISLGPGEQDSTSFTGIYELTDSDIAAGFVKGIATVVGSTPNGAQVSDLSDDPNDLTDRDQNGDGNPDDPTNVNLPEALSETGVALHTTALVGCVLLLSALVVARHTKQESTNE